MNNLPAAKTNHTVHNQNQKQNKIKQIRTKPHNPYTIQPLKHQHQPQLNLQQLKN